MDPRDFLDAIAGLTNTIMQDRAAAAADIQQLVAQNQALVGLLQAQQAQPPAPAPAPAAPPAAAPPRVSQSVVETIPVFNGGVGDFPQDFVDCVDRIAAVEGWNDQQRIQVAVRRLAKTAKDWHNHSGHNQAAWADWSAPTSPGPVRAGRGRGAPTGYDPRECYRCRRTGHIARDCPVPPKGSAGV